MWHRFHDAHAGAVGQATDQVVNALKLAKETLYFVSSEDRRQTGCALGALDPIEPREVDADDLFVQEQNRALRLVLRRRGHVARDGKVGQERFDVAFVALRRMALVVQDDKATNPIDVGLFRTISVVLAADTVAYAREATRGCLCDLLC